MMSMSRYLLAGAAAWAIGFAAPQAQAANIQLGFILDSSGSIGSSNWTTIKNGLATAINNLIPTTGDDTYYISIVNFSNNADIVAANYEVTAASKAGLISLINGMTFKNSTTNYQDAFLKMNTALGQGSGLPDFDSTYVNLSTDGQPNVCNSGTTCNNTNQVNAASIAAKNAMMTDRLVDNLSVEGIGSGVDASFLQANFCEPAPCSTTTPFNFPDQGFYIAVADANAYVGAIDYKIRVVTGQPVPEPATLALFGVGLAGLGMVVRRRRAAA